MKSPFKFLDSYTKDDREVFFGRNREIEELYHRVFESKIMLVYGVSGTGKSSLIHCGLANKFQDTDWLPVVIRRRANIINSMSAAIKAASVTSRQETGEDTSVSRKDVLSLYLDNYKPVFFIFDQFEELFIFGENDERRAFIQVIKSLYESDLQCRMIFIMREEYLSGITEFEKYIPAIFSNRVRIEKMSHRNAIEAIKGPCKMFNISLEEGFAESLLEKLSPGSEDVELTYMQVFLDKIFRLAIKDKPPLGGGGGSTESNGGSSSSHFEEPVPLSVSVAGGQGDVSFTLSLLLKTGDVSDLLGNFLDEQVALMEDPEIAMAVLKAFVSGKGTKRQANEPEAIDHLKSFGKEISSSAMQEMIRRFVNLRVLRDKDDNDRYELRHDTLAEKIFEKFSSAERELLEIRQLIENAYQYYLKRKVLLSHDDLEEIAGRDSMMNLNPELQVFMNESRQNQQARKRAVKILTIISSFALLLLISTILYTLKETSDKTESVLLAKESITQFTRPVDRLSLAGQAWKVSKTEEAKEALLKSFNSAIRNPGENKELLDLKNRYLSDFIHVSSPIIYASCSHDNRFIYGFTEDSVFLWETNGRLYKGFSSGGSGLTDIQMTTDGRYIGAVNKDSTLIVWDNLGHPCFSHKIGFNSVNKEHIFRFETKNRIIVISSDKKVELLDNKGKLIQSFDNHIGDINVADISPDNRFIATGGSDSTVNIWYFNSLAQKYDFYYSIHYPDETIMSVEFAPNGKYVLTTSDSGGVRVNGVNGFLVWGTKETYLECLRKIAPGHPVSAGFNDSGKGIVIKSKEKESEREKYFMFGIYTDINYRCITTGQINKFDYLCYSPDDKSFIVTSAGDNFLISYEIYSKSDYAVLNNYKLLQIDGVRPFYSPDGKYVFSICGNHIESWFIDIESISSIASGFYKNWPDYF